MRTWRGRARGISFRAGSSARVRDSTGLQEHAPVWPRGLPRGHGTVRSIDVLALIFQDASALTLDSVSFIPEAARMNPDRRSGAGHGVQEVQVIGNRKRLPHGRNIAVPSVFPAAGPPRVRGTGLLVHISPLLKTRSSARARDRAPHDPRSTTGFQVLRACAGQGHGLHIIHAFVRGPPRVRGTGGAVPEGDFLLASPDAFGRRKAAAQEEGVLLLSWEVP